ncbi:hypothetical protein GCM10018953_08850 [Streptosporangium nondiastaticum]|uniref:hypothetical protein n=1 Tax=Streptosporangium nondiastaticum TaxID=35764 RepID=UPI0031F8255C
MARHDREESLEEQLAWLDAIKEQEEVPPVPAKNAVDDATAVSPYPRDPWGLVAAEPEPETTSAQLLRAAVDSAYAPSDTSPGTGGHPAEDADAADWMNAGSTAGAFAVPPFGGALLAVLSLVFPLVLPAVLPVVLPPERRRLPGPAEAAAPPGARRRRRLRDG